MGASGPASVAGTARARKGHIESFLEKADRALDAAVEQGIKKADDVLDTAVGLGKMTASEAKRASAALHERALEEGRRGRDGGSGGRRGGQAGSRGGGMAEGPAASSRTDALEALAKLGELRSAKVITDKEFREKKAKLLKEV